MNEQEAKSKLEATCRECGRFKEEHSKLNPILESDSQKMKELKQKQIDLKPNHTKYLAVTTNFFGYDKISSIHYCYTGCDKNIARRE